MTKLLVALRNLSNAPKKHVNMKQTNTVYKQMQKIQVLNYTVN